MKDHTVSQATLARMAGNIAGALVPPGYVLERDIDAPIAAAIARQAVLIVRAIVEELDAEQDDSWGV